MGLINHPTGVYIVVLSPLSDVFYFLDFIVQSFICHLQYSSALISLYLLSPTGLWLHRKSYSLEPFGEIYIYI